MRTPFERFRKSLTKDNLWIYILKLLQKKEMYPYEIRNKIKEEFEFKPGNMTAYIVLKKLESSNYVKVVRTEKKLGPERKYYKITPKGKEELDEAIRFCKNQGKTLELS